VGTGLVSPAFLCTLIHNGILYRTGLDGNSSQCQPAGRYTDPYMAGIVPAAEIKMSILFLDIFWLFIGKPVYLQPV